MTTVRFPLSDCRMQISGCCLRNASAVFIALVQNFLVDDSVSPEPDRFMWFWMILTTPALVFSWVDRSGLLLMILSTSAMRWKYCDIGVLRGSTANFGPRLNKTSISLGRLTSVAFRIAFWFNDGPVCVVVVRSSNALYFLSVRRLLLLSVEWYAISWRKRNCAWVPPGVALMICCLRTDCWDVSLLILLNVFCISTFSTDLWKRSRIPCPS